jgi:Magnesium transporter NIPA
VAIVLIYLSRRVGEKSITIDLGLVAIFGTVFPIETNVGGFTALSTKGISSLLSLSFYRIFTFPITYLLLFVLISTAILQVKYLNKALARFSSTVSSPMTNELITASHPNPIRHVHSLRRPRLLNSLQGIQRSHTTPRAEIHIRLSIHIHRSLPNHLPTPRLSTSTIDPPSTEPSATDTHATGAHRACVDDRG